MGLRRLSIALRTALALALTIASLVVAVVAAPTPPATAASTTLCYGFSQCNSRGFGNAGYEAVYTSSHYGADGGHNCTNYASYRMIQNGTGAAKPWHDSQGRMGNAKEWGHLAPQFGFRVDQSPTVGSIAWWDAGNGRGSLGHVAYVEQVNQDGSVVISQDSFGGDFSWEVLRPTDGTPRTGWPAGFIHAKDTYEGQIIRRTDGVSWVVQGGQRHVLTFSADVCAVYLRRLTAVAGFSYAEALRIPEDTAHPYDCSLNGYVLQATDGPDPKPSFYFHNGKRYSIPDAQTWRYWTLGKSIPTLPLPRSVATDSRFPNGGVEPAKLYAPDWEGKIIRRSDGISWVVTGGLRHHLPNYATDVCAQYAQGREARGGFVDSQTSSIKEGFPFACDLNGHILRSNNQPDPKPAFVYHDNKRYWLRDVWTYDYYVRAGYGVVDMPHAAITDDRLTDGGTETPKLNPLSIPVNTIIRRNDGVSWVVDGSRVRHHIPYRQDDVCWRNLGGDGFPPLSVSATNLTYDQARQLTEGSAWPCIIGNRVVRSSDNSSWFVDTTNTRHWIPDTDTYGALAGENPVSGPWAASDVNQLPQGSDMPRRLDPAAVKNTIICRDDGVCWAVDNNGVRHHIPTYADNVCWRWKNGWHVSRNNLSYDLANTLREAEPWGCSLDNVLIATNQGPAYYMQGNERRWIPDGYDFECLQRGRTVIRGMSLDEASGIHEIGAMPAQECAGIDIVTIRSAYNRKVVTTEINYGGNDYGMVRAGRDSVGSYWEMFRLIGNCYDSCLIQSLNNRKLWLAQLNYQGYAWGEVRGASDNPGGSWERFRIRGDCNTGCSIQALGWTQDTRYLSAEFDYTGAGYGMLRARATSVGGWERFIIQ